MSVHVLVCINVILREVYIFNFICCYDCQGLFFCVLGDNPIVETQLSEIEAWTSEFKTSTKDSEDDIVLDILAGDFNIDNMSPGSIF